MILTREERTQAVIDGFKDLPGEFHMLKGLLCLEQPVGDAARKKSGERHGAAYCEERDQFGKQFNMLMIAERMDALRGAAGAPA